jgi:hypothetical protein
VFAFILNIVFNVGIMEKTDKEIIETLGGPTEVAKLLGYDLAKGGAQKVYNWLTRGIPAKVKVQHPELFLNFKYLGGVERRRDPGRRDTDQKIGRRKRRPANPQ